MTDPPRDPQPPSGRSPLRVVLGVVYVLVALGGSGLLAVLAAFAVSPTICPDEGGSYLCGDGPGGLLTVAGVGLLLLLVVGFAVVVPAARTAGRASSAFAASLGSAILAIVVISWAASTWS